MKLLRNLFKSSFSYRQFLKDHNVPFDDFFYVALDHIEDVYKKAEIRTKFFHLGFKTITEEDYTEDTLRKHHDIVSRSPRFEIFSLDNEENQLFVFLYDTSDKSWYRVADRNRPNFVKIGSFKNVCDDVEKVYSYYYENTLNELTNIGDKSKLEYYKRLDKDIIQLLRRLKP